MLSGLLSVPPLLKILAPSAQVDLAVPLAVTVQHCVALPYSIVFPPYGPHTFDVGTVPPIPPAGVMVDVMPNIPPGSLVAVVKLPGFDEVVVMIEEVEDVLVILVLLGCVVVDVAVSHVEDIMPIAEFWNSREQEFWIHDFASGVNWLQVHPP